MSNVETMTKPRRFVIRSFGLPSSFVIRLPRRSPAKAGHSSFSGNERGDRKTSRTGADTSAVAEAFTILELLVVIGIIVALAGLILATVGYVQKKGARSRAEAEIAAISAALESYRADNGIYPNTANTNTLDARSASAVNPSTYQTASFDLYASLTGDTNGDRTTNASDANPSAKSYFNFRPNQLNPAPPSTGTVTSIRDPFGNSYGYSTAYEADLEKTPPVNPTHGYNPTFDLWSTAGGTTTNDVAGWVKNW
jgi:general secretion pathway protein G